MAAARSSSATAVSRVSPASWGTASSPANSGSPMRQRASASMVSRNRCSTASWPRSAPVKAWVNPYDKEAASDRVRPNAASSPASSSASPARSRSTNSWTWAVVARRSRRAWPVRTVMVSGLPAV